MKMKMQFIPTVIIVLAIMFVAAFVLVACNESVRKKKAPPSFVTHLDWSKNAVIYEVNVRQYTPEGTFEAFAEHLPRLKELGVDILWFMPIHPIGEKNRKGSLGSYYSVKDYVGINPEFGTLDDFKAVVEKAHELEMYVILDWVANHTAWDHEWIDKHPEWYEKNEEGEIFAPFDWTDVAQLDFSNQELRKAMTESLKYWITEADIDGYRCDVAGEVPTDFWNDARKELDQIKPVFMLAEAELPEHHSYAFDMSYAWELHHIMNSIAKGEKNINDLDNYFAKNDTLFPADAYRMNFITNHDENSWNGTAFERMGEAVEVFAVLSFTLPGMPMIYSGQEAGLDKRLKFFEKDTITWDTLVYSDLYSKLSFLRKQNEALWGGTSGGKLERVQTSADEHVYAFMRQKGDSHVIVIANLSPVQQSFEIKQKIGDNPWRDAMTGEMLDSSLTGAFNLDKWDYRIYTNM